MRAESFSENDKRREKLPKVPAPIHPKALEAQYRKRMQTIVKAFLAVVKRETLARMPKLIEQAKMLQTGALDTFEDELAAFNRRLEVAITQVTESPLIRETAAEFAEKTERFSDRRIVNQVEQVLGVAPVITRASARPLLETFIAQNTELIKDVGAQFRSEVSRLVTNAVVQGQTNQAAAREIVSSLRKEMNGSETKVLNRAKLIARDQIASLNGRMTALRQQELGIKKYIWQTSNDERVRPEHEARDGRVYAWDNPPADGHPGQPINCRCVAVPVIESALE